jgi:hypothetical protein
MKKWLWLLPIAALLALAACSMPGNVYMSFDWPSDITSYYSNDPNIHALSKGHEYLTLPGDYYFDYEDGTINQDLWGFYYTLTAHKGAGSPGEDAIFRIYLPNPGYPALLQLQGLGANLSGSSTPSAASSMAVRSRSIFDNSNYQFKQLGEYSQTQGGYTLTVRTGVWEPKK